MSATELSTPLQIDTQLAQLDREAARLGQKLLSAMASIYHIAGARRSYRGRSSAPQWNMSFDEATTKLSLTTTNHDELGYKTREAAQALADYDYAKEELETKEKEIRKVNDLYTGWSRFFVVTSSAGHIHASKACSTCRPSTTFGWLPHLSGQTEGEAVEACGSALCSVCFPTAPVEHQGGTISPEYAGMLSRGMTIAAIEALKRSKRDAKAEAKAEKARKAAERARKHLAKVEAAYAKLGGREAVLARKSVYELTSDLPAMVGNTITADHHAHHGTRPFDKTTADWQKIIEAGEAA